MRAPRYAAWNLVFGAGGGAHSVGVVRVMSYVCTVTPIAGRSDHCGVDCTVTLAPPGGQGMREKGEEGWRRDRHPGVHFSVLRRRGDRLHAVRARPCGRAGNSGSQGSMTTVSAAGTRARGAGAAWLVVAALLALDGAAGCRPSTGAVQVEAEKKFTMCLYAKNSTSWSRSVFTPEVDKMTSLQLEGCAFAWPAPGYRAGDVGYGAVCGPDADAGKAGRSVRGPDHDGAHFRVRGRVDARV